jgi:hypothetical protein
MRELPHATDLQRIEWAHRTATSRRPTTNEVKVLKQLLDDQRERMDSGAIVKTDLVGIPAPMLKQLTGYEAREVLPWIVVSRAILNLDETITKE